MATHSSVLAWRIPWTEEPGGLQSMGLQRVGTLLKRLGMHKCTSLNLRILYLTSSGMYTDMSCLISVKSENVH